MMRRLRKELTALRPFWIGLLVLELAAWVVVGIAGDRLVELAKAAALPGKVSREQIASLQGQFASLQGQIVAVGNWYIWVCFVLGIVQVIAFHLMAVGTFGSEFSDHTLGRLLALYRYRFFGHKTFLCVF